MRYLKLKKKTFQKLLRQEFFFLNCVYSTNVSSEHKPTPINLRIFLQFFLSYDTDFFWAFDEYEGFWNFIAQKQGSIFWRFLSKNIDNRQTITTLFWTYLFMSSFCYTFRIKDIMYVLNESKTQTWAKKALTQCTRKKARKIRKRNSFKKWNLLTLKYTFRLKVYIV